MLRVQSKVASRGATLRISHAAVDDRTGVAVTTVFALLAVGLAYRLSISQDEAYSLHTTSRGFIEALRQGIVYEAQAPLYFGVLAAWRLAGGSLFAARLLSLALSLVTLGITWRFAKRYIADVAPSIVLAAVAFNPFMIWATVEARPYAAAITLSTALLYTFFRGWMDRAPSWPARAAFILVAIAGAYTQYYVVTLVAAAGVSLVVCRNVRGLPSFAGAALVVALALTPLIVILPGQLGAYSALAKIALLPGYSILLALCEFLYPHHWMGSWIHQPPQTAVYFCAAAIPAGMALAWLQTVRRTALALGVISVTLAAIFAVFIQVGRIHVIFPRQTAVLFAPTLFGAFALAEGIRRDRRGLVIGTFCATYATLVCLSLWSDYRGLSKSGDWDRVASYLVSHAGGADAVAVFDPEVTLPLGYYFKAAPLVAVPRPLSFDRFDEEAFTIRSDRELEASLGRAAHRRRRVWLVVNEVCTTLPQFYGCDRLDTFVARHFKKVSVATFNGSSVIELQPVAVAARSIISQQSAVERRVTVGDGLDVEFRK